MNFAWRSIFFLRMDRYASKVKYHHKTANKTNAVTDKGPPLAKIPIINPEGAAKTSTDTIYILPISRCVFPQINLLLNCVKPAITEKIEVNTCMKKATIQTEDAVSENDLNTHCLILKKATSVSRFK